jgi:hypothetical protein
MTETHQSATPISQPASQRSAGKNLELSLIRVRRDDARPCHADNDVFLAAIVAQTDRRASDMLGNYSSSVSRFRFSREMASSDGVGQG